MAVNLNELQRHLDDYAEVTGRRVERFVCPITERECDVGELIDGHILNGGIKSASRRTVIQYRNVDNFYGHQVEAGFVHFINLPRMSAAEMLGRPVLLRYADGTELRGFTAGAAAAVRFPLSDPIYLNGEEVARVYLRTDDMDDPHIFQQPVYAEIRESYTPSHVTAAMIKAAYLCLFSKMGYRAVKSPFGEFVRQPLHAYFRDNGQRDDAYRYFYPFRNAQKPVLDAITGWPQDTGPDTLNDDHYILHFKEENDLVFAITLRFKMNDVVFMVTLPMSLTNVVNRGEDVKATYNHLMAAERSVAQYIRWIKLRREGFAYLSDRQEMIYQQPSYPPD